MDILLERYLDVETDESGPVSVRLLIRKDDVGITVNAEVSLWQNERSFTGPVTSYFDEGNLSIDARLQGDI